MPGVLGTRAHAARGLPARHAASGGGAGRGARPSARRHALDHRRRARASSARCRSRPSTTCCDALTDAGLVRRIQPPGSVARYESRVGDNHHHVVCRSCGAIADVDCAVGDGAVPDRVRRPRLRDRRGRGHLLGPVPRCSATAVPDTPDPERVPLSEQPDAVVGEMNEDEAEGGCPVAHGRAPHPTAGRRQPRLVAGPAQPEDPRQEPRRGQPARRGLRLRRGVQDARPRRGQAGHRGGPDDLAGLVAGRLRPLRPVHDPDGLAQRRHVPHQRRPRRRRRRPAALRAAQQLARQRQPRQGAPAAVAGQEEVRPGALVGRPDGPHRQRRAGVDGLRDLRLRRRPRGRLGARRGRLLGPGDDLARRRALHAATASSRSRSAPSRWA